MKTKPEVANLTGEEAKKVIDALGMTEKVKEIYDLSPDQPGFGKIAGYSFVEGCEELGWAVHGCMYMVNEKTGPEGCWIYTGMMPLRTEARANQVRKNWEERTREEMDKLNMKLISQQ